jgi:hypothetical protein
VSIAIIFQKQKELSLHPEKLEKVYVLETKIVSLSSVARFMGKKGINK